MDVFVIAYLICCKLGLGALSIMKIIISTAFMILPYFVYFGSFIMQGLYILLKILAYLETFLICLGVATIIGILTGCFLYFFSSILISRFGPGKFRGSLEGDSVSLHRTTNASCDSRKVWIYSGSKDPPRVSLESTAYTNNESLCKHKPSFVHDTIIEENECNFDERSRESLSF